MSNHWIIRTVAAVAFGAAMLSPLAAQEAQQIPGTSVALPAPDGYAFTQGIGGAAVSGFINDETQGIITVGQFDVSTYDVIAKGMTDVESANTLFASQNIVADTVTSIDTANGAAQLLHGSQDIGDGTTAEKWIALLQNPDTKDGVFIETTTSEGDFDEAGVKAILDSISFTAAPTLAEQLDALPFAAEASEPFSTFGVEGGTIVMLAPDQTADSGAVPTILIDGQPNVSGMPALQEAAEGLVTGLFSDIAIETSEAVAFAGQDGWIVTGTGTDERDGPVTFTQWFAPVDTGFVRMAAYADNDTYTALADAMKSVAATVTWKD